MKNKAHIHNIDFKSFLVAKYKNVLNRATLPLTIAQSMIIPVALAMIK